MPTNIPKRIIQTGKEAIQPLRNRAMMTTVRLLNPDYEFMFFDDKRVNSFIDEEFPQYRAIYDAFHFPIQRIDFFRYLAVYRYGGFYFDLDVMLATDLSSLLQFGCVFPFEGLTFSDLLRSGHNMDWEIGNYAFGAAPGHPFLEAVIENCIRAQREPGWVKKMMRGVPLASRSDFYVLYSTGPGLVTRTLAENTELRKSVTVLFPEDVCDSNNWSRFGDLGIHYMIGSWRVRRGWLRNRIVQRWEQVKFQRLLKKSILMGKTRENVSSQSGVKKRQEVISGHSSEPLVSILIPACNAQEWIAETIGSAMGQTWKNKEIVIVDDGSTDRTFDIARKFESEDVRVVTQRRQGAASARNKALSMCRGDYIQWLDADDLLSPNKISLQMKLAMECGNPRVLFSSPWGKFIYRHRRARFIPTEVWCDLSPLEWLIRKAACNVFLQTACWLVSRELTEAAGPWNATLLSDDDGEYFSRILRASDSVRFVPEAKVFYRGPGTAFQSLSYIGQSTAKIEAHWRSMLLHISYLRGMEDSARVREACVRYIQASLLYFFPERPDIVMQAADVVKELGGKLQTPSLSWKYSWMQRWFGWGFAKFCRRLLVKSRWKVEKAWDQTQYRIEKSTGVVMQEASQFAKRAYGSYQRAVARSTYRRPFVVHPRVPIISFTFDDFPRSALLTGGAILESFGLAGTYYVSLGLIGKQGETGELLEIEDLRTAMERGHELGCHTFNHCNAWNTDPTEFEDSVIKNGQAIRELNPGASFKSLSYPIGLPRAKTKKRVSSYFSCCRGGGQTFNFGKSDLNYLSAYFIEQSREDPGAIKRIIDENCQAGGWLIFATHDVSENPTPWGCTPELFRDIVQYSVKSGAQILPVSLAYESLDAKSSMSQANLAQPLRDDPTLI